MNFISGFRLIVSAFAFTGLLGCDPGDDATTEISVAQSEPELTSLKYDLINDNLEPRLKYGLLPNGFYQPQLARDWTPLPLEQQKASLISQSRFMYIMAMGYEVTSDPRYLSALELSSGYLLEHFLNPHFPGHWYSEVTPDGTVTNPGFHAYGHAHVLLALSHAFKVTGDPKFKEAAFQTWLALGVPSAIAGKNQFYELHGLNVAMHLFESLLVFYKATELPMVYDDLTALGEYIVSHFYSPKGGFFGEGLTADLQLEADGEIRLGHSIEMAFLLSRAVAVGLPSRYLQAANTSVDFVAAIAAKNPQGLIPHTADFNGDVKDPTYYWWPQTELLRALAHFSVQRDRTDLQAQFEKSRALIRKQFLDTEFKGWYGNPDEKGKNKGHQWKVGYHVIMMQTELMRLHGAEFRSGSEVLL